MHCWILKLKMLAFFVLFAKIITFGQQFNNPWKALKGDMAIAYGIDNRRTHIHGQNTLIYGLYGGLSFEDVVKIKMGFSGTPFEKGNTKDDLDFYTKNRFYFINIGEEYTFYTLKRYSFTSYLQVGYGFNHYRQIDSTVTEVGSGRNVIIPLEVGFNAQYELWYWLDLKVGLGWRFMFPEVSNDLSGYYVKIGFSTTSRKLLDRYKAWKEERE